ncbi:intracellular hyaluronan-binding protein 4 isoform X2 [Stegostoma tigrinum]|uniref:intracellular hyaluronan-binding protein 4 isoform X2 n=1 Tax=Stegostoma tigrinum TaxID=3053191 RepID=UPI0028708ECE|nr:intracellular hyaluronan-binding protein 4 isoform X2 [Stegostoma tigrinum]
MKGVLLAAAAMQETFGCAVTNRFDQLLDDESDPFDILREAEEKKQKKKKEEGGRKTRAGIGASGSSATATAGAAYASASNSTKAGRRESQKARKIPTGVEAGNRPGGTSSTENVFLGGGGGGGGGGQRREGPKRGPKRAELRGQNENQDIERKTERPERRVVFRERRPNETEGATEFSLEAPIDRVDRPIKGRGGGRGRGRGRGGFPRSVDGFDPRGKREFERHSGNDKVGLKPEDKRGGSGSRNWGAVRDDMRETETAPVEEATEMEESQDALEGDTENKLNEGEHEATVDDGPHEMTLDEWKALQEQTRFKKEFNIRKPDSSVLLKAVVIHKSKYEGDEQKEESDEEDHHYFRRSANDITSKLDINFGSLTRPGRGRGGARGRGRAKRIAETRPEVPAVDMTRVSAPNPDDPEDFPALA